MLELCIMFLNHGSREYFRYMERSDRQPDSYE